MNAVKFVATYFVALPVACLLAAAFGPFVALGIAAFFQPAKIRQGCEFQPTDYMVKRAAGDRRVCVCEWCGRTAFQVPGGEMPKSDRCGRPRFGLGDLAERVIAVGTLGLVRKSPGCGCEGIQRAMNEKRYFVARPWWRKLLERTGLRKRPLPPWENPNFANREFVKESAQHG
jgi:hypothetical protein